MQNITEETMTTAVIDLNAAEDKKLEESFLRMFGNLVKVVMRRAFGEDVAIPVKVRGTTQQVDAFSKTLAAEKRYLEAYKSFGLNDAKTYASKYDLDKAVRGFELKTGLKWPFK